MNTPDRDAVRAAFDAYADEVGFLEGKDTWFAAVEWAIAAMTQKDCGNCFEGKSDMDHACRQCGGTGKAPGEQT